MKDSRKGWKREEPAKKDAITKPMDPQLVEKLYSISKLNNRIRERLKNMAGAMDKGRS